MDEARATLRAGVDLSGDQITLDTLASEWLVDVRPSLAHKTYVSYELLLRIHLLPTLGRKKLSKIGPRDIQAAYSALLSNGVSAATIGNAHRALHTCLERAVRWGHLAKNPSDYVDRPKVTPREMARLSEEEVQRFLGVTRGHRLEALFSLALTTGARNGELLGLQWSDVDLDHGTIRIRQSLKKIRGGYELGDTKTPKSRREVEIGPASVQQLRSHRAGQDEEILRLGPAWDSSWGLVFANTVGRPLDQRHVLQRQFRPLALAAGLPSTLRFHDLRHIFASLTLSKGMEVARVSAMLGHSNPATTYRVYNYAIPGSGRTVAAVMDKILAG